MWESEENHTQRPVYSLLWCEEDRLRVGDRERSPERRAESSWGGRICLGKESGLYAEGSGVCLK